MRKFTLIAALFFAVNFAFSQTPLTVAVDFTATGTDGIEYNLFDILAGGQHVCIDFFFTT
ncbi:MAG: hypothetical protein R2764_05830 [Bacteroidales bacterium]